MYHFSAATPVTDVFAHLHRRCHHIIVNRYVRRCQKIRSASLNFTSSNSHQKGVSKLLQRNFVSHGNSKQMKPLASASGQH